MDIDTKVKKNNEIDKWLNEILEQDSFIKVGVIASPDENTASKSTDLKDVRGKSNSIKKNNDGLTVVDVARWHEFGLGNNPERSFLRSTWDDNKKALPDRFFKTIKKVSKNNGDIKEVLHNVGVWMKRKVQQKFTKNNWEDLSKGTKRARKQTNPKPLIDTNQLRGSISYEVVEKENK